MMKTITKAKSISAKKRSRTSSRDSCHRCLRAASLGRRTSMSRSSSASTVPNGGGWLNRFPNIYCHTGNPFEGRGETVFPIFPNRGYPSFADLVKRSSFEHKLDSYRRCFLSSTTRGSKKNSPPESSEARSPQLEATSVIKLDIVNRLADETGIPKLKAEQAVDALFHSMKEALARGERIELRGFGVFIVKPRKRGVGRNPRTGQEVAIPTGKTIRFKPGKDLHAHEGNGDEDIQS